MRQNIYYRDNISRRRFKSDLPNSPKTVKIKKNEKKNTYTQKNVG